MRRAAVVAAILAGLAAAAAAQDVRPQGARDFQAHPVDVQRSCSELDGLSLCVQPLGAPRARRAKQKPGELTRFTRLAGMFMGRVDAADWGPLKVRFKLEIQ